MAIKLLHEKHADNGRFEREARVLVDLRHPGIVRYVAHGMASGEPFIAMEWLEGEDLSRRLERGALTVAETVTLATRAAEALSAAHGRDIVHRDLKPANLFVVSGDVAQVKILDFGIAWLGGGTRMTATGMLLGTPAYMAPEQARSARAIDTRADVFSLGCVLFECLTGRRVFTGDLLMAVLAKVLFEEAPRVLDLRPEVPPALDALIGQMLAKEPADRPRNRAAVPVGPGPAWSPHRGAPSRRAPRAPSPAFGAFPPFRYKHLGHSCQPTPPRPPFVSKVRRDAHRTLFAPSMQASTPVSICPCDCARAQIARGGRAGVVVGSPAMIAGWLCDLDPERSPLDAGAASIGGR